VGLFPGGYVEPAARRDIGLAADDRRHAYFFFGGVVEVDRAENITPWSGRDSGRAFLGRGAGTAGRRRHAAIKQRILAVHVQMNERLQRTATLAERWGREADSYREPGRHPARVNPPPPAARRVLRRSPGLLWPRQGGAGSALRRSGRRPCFP